MDRCGEGLVRKTAVIGTCPGEETGKEFLAVKAVIPHRDHSL